MMRYHSNGLPASTISLLVLSLPFFLISDALLANDENINTTVDNVNSTDQSSHFGDEIPAYQGLTLSEYEKELYQAMFFAQVSAHMQLNDSCSADISKFCGVNHTDLSCLEKNAESLTACCSSSLRNFSDDNKIKSIKFHNDILLPIGSTLEFDPSCLTSKVNLQTPTSYLGTQLQSGAIAFDEYGQINLAKLTEDQPTLGITLSDQQPLTRVFRNGTPEYVRLSKTMSRDSMVFEPMQVNTQNRISGIDLSSASIDEVWWLLHSDGEARDPGTTQFHSNGRVARGKLARMTNINGVLYDAGITTFSKEGVVLSGTLAGENSINGLTLGAGPVQFNSKGIPLKARIASPAEFNGLSLAPGEVQFSDDGTLLTATLQAGFELNGWPLPTDAKVTFGEGIIFESFYFPRDPGSSSNSMDNIVEFAGLRMISGWPYELHPNGQLASVELSDHSVYRDIVYPRGTKIDFHPDGSISWDSFHDQFLLGDYFGQYDAAPEILPFSQVRRNVLLPKGTVLYSSSSEFEKSAILSRSIHYKDYKLALGEITFNRIATGIWKASLYRIQNINGVTYKAYPEKIEFNSDGTIQAGELAKISIINDVAFAANTNIRFNSSGTVRSGTLAEKTSIGDIPLATNMTVEFHNSGLLKTGKLADDTLINDIKFKAGSNININHKGFISSGVLAEDSLIRGIEIPSGAQLKLDKGSLASFDTNKKQRINSLLLDGRQIELREDGSLRSGVLAENSMINGEQIDAGTQILLNPKGDLLDQKKVGLIPEPRTDGVTFYVPRTTLFSLQDPPTKKECNEFFSNPPQASGWSIGTGNTKQQCQKFHAEFRE